MHTGPVMPSQCASQVKEPGRLRHLVGGLRCTGPDPAVGGGVQLLGGCPAHALQPWAHPGAKSGAASSPATDGQIGDMCHLLRRGVVAAGGMREMGHLRGCAWARR